MYFRDSQILFLHPTKTGGSTIEYYLMQSLRDSIVPRTFRTLQPLNTDSYAERHDFKKQVMFGNYQDEYIKCSLQHAPIATVRRLLGDDVFERSRKIATVRNPYTRIVSLYFYFNFAPHMSFIDFVHGVLGKLLKRSATETVYASKQSAYTHENGKCAVDLILRQESLNASLSVLSAFVDAPIRYDPHIRQRPSKAGHILKHHMDAYDERALEVVRELYRDDFELLGYPE